MPLAGQTDPAASSPVLAVLSSVHAVSSEHLKLPRGLGLQRTLLLPLGEQEPLGCRTVAGTSPAGVSLWVLDSVHKPKPKPKPKNDPGISSRLSLFYRQI